jgi:hypothetical protein
MDSAHDCRVSFLWDYEHVKGDHDRKTVSPRNDKKEKDGSSLRVLSGFPA